MECPNPLQHVHMVGIGGAGMSGIARILLARGITVTGSDMKDSRTILALRAAGATVAIGHAAANLELAGGQPDVVVTSFAAIPADNPELAGARAAGIPVARRSDVLGWLMEGNEAFLLAGTHGKTSTTSMAVAALQAAGCDPSFAIGGQLNRAGTNAHQGTGSIFVAEADESDGSFLTYSPRVAVITNIEPDHLDYFGTAEAYHEVFHQFAHRVERGGYLLVCVDDPGAVALATQLLAEDFEQKQGVTIYGYGTAAAAAAHPDITTAATITATAITPAGTTADIDIAPADQAVTLDVAIPGAHMVGNAAAAVLGAYLLGGDLERLVSGVSHFDGVRRRFESHGSVGDIAVYDDYAHHPTEVTAVLTAAREKLQATGGGRIIAVFQPHLYSRTIAFASEFAQALSLADEVVLLEIFGAREDPVEGVDSRIIIDAAPTAAPESDHETTWHPEPEFQAVASRVVQLAQPGDLVLTIGAGTVTLLADEIVRELRGDGNE